MKNLNEMALEYQALIKTPKGNRARLNQLIDNITQATYQLCRRVIRAKSIQCEYEELRQVVSIAAANAINDWQPHLASFTTHVFWQVRAELKVLELHVHPERRKVKTFAPLSFMSTNEKLGDPTDAGALTLEDIISDESAFDEIEESLLNHQVLRIIERVASHYMAAMWLDRMENHPPSLSFAQEQCLRVMRDYDIFQESVIRNQTNAEIAFEHKISRERVRQIINRFKKAVGDYLKLDADDMTPAHPAQTSHHPLWLEMVATYKEAYQRDLRLIDQYMPLPAVRYLPPIEEIEKPAIEIKIKRPKATHTKKAPAETGRKTAIDITPKNPNGKTARQLALFDEATEARRTSSEKQRKTGAMRKMNRMAIAGAVAAATAVSMPAAAQMSRAIPPQSAPTTTTAPTNPTSANINRLPPAQPFNPATATVPGPRAQISSPQSTNWAIKLGEYPTRQAMLDAEAPKRRQYPFLQGLQRGTTRLPNGQGFGIAFGPLTIEQANGYCAQIRRLNGQCTLVRTGGAPTAATQSAPAAAQRTASGASTASGVIVRRGGGSS